MTKYALTGSSVLHSVIREGTEYIRAIQRPPNGSHFLAG